MLPTLPQLKDFERFAECGGARHVPELVSARARLRAAPRLSQGYVVEGGVIKGVELCSRGGVVALRVGAEGSFCVT